MIRYNPDDSQQNIVQLLVQLMDIFNNDLYINLDIEKEKTKQSVEKTKQLHLQLEIKKLDLVMNVSLLLKLALTTMEI